MARKDIEVRIRARDEASRNAKKVADALKHLGATGDKLGSTGNKVGGALSAMAADLGKLQGKLGGIDAFGKLVTEVAKAEGGIQRLEDRLAKSQRTLSESQTRTKAAADASAELRSRIEAEVAAQKQRSDRLKELTNRQREETKAINDAAAAAQKLQNALAGGKGGFSGPRYPTRGVGIEAGDPSKSARESMGAFLAPEIDAALGDKAALEAQVARLRATNDEARQSIQQLRDAFKQASAEEKAFAGDTEKAANEVVTLKEKIDAAYTSLAKVDEQANIAAKELGGLALSQEAVAAATAKAEDELRKQAAAMAAMKRYSDGTGGVADPRTAAALRAQSAAVTEAREEWKALEAETRRLSVALNSASGDSTELYNQFKQSAQASRLAKDEYERQGKALHAMGEQGAAALTRLDAQTARRVASAQAIAGATEREAEANRKSVASAGQIAPMAQRIVNAKTQQANATDRASNAMLRFGRDTRTTLSFMQRMRGEVLALTSGFVGFYAAMDRGQKAMDAFMAVEKAENRLGVAFEGDTAKVAREIRFLNEQADRLGFTFEALANGYGRISIAASNAGFSVADTRELFTSLAEAARVNGSSMDELNGVMRALDQMMSKGKVQAEELRGQLGDRMSGAFKMFADGLGMTTAQLDEAMKKGEVYADRETMLAFARRLQEAYGKRVPAAMKTLAASLGTFERDMEKTNLLLANGFVPALQDALKAFHEFTNSADGQETFRAMGEAAGSLISVLALIPQHFDLIIDAAKVLIAVGVARAFTGIVTTIGQSRAAFVALSASMTGAAAPTNMLTGAQRTLMMGVRQTSFALALYESRLRSSASSSALARAGTLALATSVAGLRSVMLSTAAIARGMWALIGGPVGAAALGIGLIIANWETNADRATAALDTHERHLQSVRTAYEQVGQGVDDWAKKIKGLTELDARRSVAQLEQQFESALSGIADRARTIQNLVKQALRGGEMTDPDYLRDVQELDRLVQGFMAGTVEIEEFKKGLSTLALESTSGGVRTLAEDINNMVDETDGAGKTVGDYGRALKEARAILGVVTGQTEEATEETLNLESAVDDLNTTFDNSKFVEEYSKAIDELKEKIPSLAGEMERLKDQIELNQIAWKGLVAAWNAGDYSKLGEVAKLWAMATGQLNEQSALSVFEGTSGFGGSAGALLKKFEGFRSTPYDDGRRDGNGNRVGPAVYRAGYGSDTVTLADGSVQKVVQGMTVTLADAERDLARRIVEFQNVIKGQVGEGRFNSFNEQQQAALTSVAYNYGSLPERIVDAVRTGSAAEISSAIRGLGGDNGGINRGRRDLEATIFNSGGDANIGTLVEAEQDRREEIEEQNEATKQRIADLDHQIAQQRLINADKEREAAIEDAIREARAENPNLSEQELQSIRDKTAALWDQQNAMRELELAEERINNLQSLRQALMEQMDQARAAGDQGQVTALKTELDEVNARLMEAIANGIRMWEAVGGDEAAAKIANLKTMQGAITASRQQFGLFNLSMDTWRQVFDGAITGAVGAFDAMAQAIANGANAWYAFGSAALQVLAQVIQQIAVAILQMQILKMLQGFGGPIGSFATAALGGGATGHTGGIVGSKAIGGGNAIRTPSWITSALTYHSGGIAGLRPDEVSATLKKGEEILTEEDPRHRFNQGGGKSADKGARLKQVLAIGDSEIANAMSGGAGEQVTVTHIKRNAATIRRMLGL